MFKMKISTKRLISLSVIGLVSGSVFGIILKLIEQLTGKSVYILLLNVDYFPVLKDLSLSESIEFSFHLVVSMIVTIVLYGGLKPYDRHHQIAYYVVLNSVIGAILFLTTRFSNRTPELSDGIAFMYWLFGHALFGLIIGWLIRWHDQRMKRKS